MTTTPTFPSTPKPTHKGRRFLTWSITVVASLIIGANLGGGDAPAEAETVTKTVEVTPDVCVTALNRADEMLTIAGEGFGITSEAITAASMLDLAGMDASTQELAALNDRALTIDYRGPADECLAGAK